MDSPYKIRLSSKLLKYVDGYLLGSGGKLYVEPD